MSHVTALEMALSDRLSELQCIILRLDLLLQSSALVPPELGISNRSASLITPLRNRLEHIKARATCGGGSGLWTEIADLRRDCRAVGQTELAFFGGVALAHGLAGSGYGADPTFTVRVETWLNDVRARLGLDRKLILVADSGPLLDSVTGIVRIPFLDWDLWHATLVARAVGLLATYEPGPFHEAFDGAIRSIPALIAAGPELREQKQQYYKHLFADVVATLVIGPAYALPTFVLEFDYSRPNEYALENPDQIEGRDTAPRFLPGPVDRAAAILITLEAMNAGVESRHRDPPFAEISARLKDMWHDAVASARQEDTLDAICAEGASEYTGLARAGLECLPYQLAQRVGMAWEHAQLGITELERDGRWPEPPAMLDELIGALWLYRLDHPERADYAAETGARLLRSEPVGVLVREKAASCPMAGRVARARVDRLQARCERLVDLLAEQSTDEGDRTVVAGRFYRALSQHYFDIGHMRPGIADGMVRFGLWSKVSECEGSMRPLQREALEFLGGSIIRHHELDREPVEVSQLPDRGPSICDLADDVLSGYARQTGVNWSAHAVLGSGSLVATDTDVVRVQFPDWSVWNLALVGHEFGHVAAFATRAFLDFELEQGRRHAAAGSTDAAVSQAHLMELFADVFATYTLGPAFPCCSILLQFDPVDAFRWRKSHPTYMERVRVLLQVLEAMNRMACDRPMAQGPYVAVLESLQQAWEQSVAACGVVPNDQKAFDEQLMESLRLGFSLFVIVDRSYRLAAAYTPARWDVARRIGEQLVTPPVPSYEQLQSLARSVGGLTAADLLNAYWSARLELVCEPWQISHLRAAIAQTCDQLWRALPRFAHLPGG